MIKVKNREMYLVLCLVLAVVIMFLPTVYTFFYHNLTVTPKAINGQINLLHMSSSEKIYLDGQWEFYWHRFIVTEPESEQVSKADLLIKVPDSWSNYEMNGRNLPAEGFGSYKLTLTGFKPHNAIALCIPNFGGAYRLFVDGKLVSRSGIVSKDMKKIFTVPKAELYPITLSTNLSHEVVIEVATTRFSGLYMTPVMSDYSQITNENSVRNDVRLILFGIALFSLLSLIVMYLVTIRQKLLSFWFPIMIFFILFRLMLTSEFYSFWQNTLFFGISYEHTNELMYFATFTLKYLLIFLVQEQCGIAFSKREKAGFLTYYILLYLIYLCMPQSIYNHYLSVIVPMLTYVLDVYLFVKIFRGRHTIRKFGMVIFWGAILVMAGLTIDSLYINGKTHMNMSLSMMVLFTVFLLVMNWVYAMRSIDLYDNFTKSASRLELANDQIAMQKEYYIALSGQMNEIREMKHDIRHFIGAMSRLADDRRFDELKAFLSEYGKKTEMEQLPVFCENIVANSIIGYYYLQAKEYGIFFESQCNLGSSAMSDSDLCVVLGNALENAIDACRQMENHEKRFVSIEIGTMKRQQLIKVRNSYNGHLVIVDERYVSSKQGNHHNMGIRNIERVIASCGGLIKIEHNDKEFSLSAAVPENK